jgi:nucleotide-binding universal stress UspA family protein
MFNKIIWASDGSESAARALPTALELVEAANGSLLVVHVDERFGARVDGGSVLADEEDIQARLEEQVRKLSENGTDASLRVVRGTNRQPADLIANVARDTDADLIVVWTRGHGRIAGALLGSVAQRLLHVAPCPVVAVPARVKAAAGAR